MLKQGQRRAIQNAALEVTAPVARRAVRVRRERTERGLEDVRDDTRAVQALVAQLNVTIGQQQAAIAQLTTRVAALERVVF